MYALPKNDLIIRVGGGGGEGVISVGDLITQAWARAGLDVYTFKTFPAEIKGGYAMYQMRAVECRVAVVLRVDGNFIYNFFIYYLLFRSL